jgi:hypothetical protein
MRWAQGSCRRGSPETSHAHEFEAVTLGRWRGWLAVTRRLIAVLTEWLWRPRELRGTGRVSWEGRPWECCAT